MLERVFRRAVHLELEDVDRAPLPDDGVASALPVLDFAEDELAHQFEDEPHERLAVKLVSLLARLFRSGGENGVYPLHELIDFSGTEGFEEIHYLDFLVVVVETCVQGEKPFVEAEFHLVVRQAYRVAVEFLLVILDCEVAGLVGEDAHLVEPSDSRDEDEADVRVLAFYDPVERLEDFSERVHESLVADRVQKRLVLIGFII